MWEVTTNLHEQVKCLLWHNYAILELGLNIILQSGDYDKEYDKVFQVKSSYCQYVL